MRQYSKKFLYSSDDESSDDSEIDYMMTDMAEKIIRSEEESLPNSEESSDSTDSSDHESSDSSEGVDNEFLFPENDNDMRSQIFSLQYMILKSDLDWIREIRMIFPKVVPNTKTVAAYKRWRVYNICSFFEIDSFFEYCEIIKHNIEFFP